MKNVKFLSVFLCLSFMMSAEFAQSNTSYKERCVLQPSGMGYASPCVGLVAERDQFYNINKSRIFEIDDLQLVTCHTFVGRARTKVAPMELEIRIELANERDATWSDWVTMKFSGDGSEFSGFGTPPRGIPFIFDESKIQVFCSIRFKPYPAIPIEVMLESEQLKLEVLINGQCIYNYNGRTKERYKVDDIFLDNPGYGIVVDID